jgi:coenzyme F420 hydrogenase subunit beta
MKGISILQANISEIIKQNICSGCGTCYSICPLGAITLQIDKSNGIYLPVINEHVCNHCGICLKVCPGTGIEHSEFKDDGTENRLIGNYLNCYVGFATNVNIRFRAASGGLVTGLLKFAKEKGLIDAALTTRFKDEKPLEPEPFIASTINEMLESRGSKYCPVAANICLKEIIEDERDTKYAVIGLPCHIEGLRKAEIIKPYLKNKINYRFGLFCHHGVSFRGTEFLLKKLKIRKEGIRHFQYRGDGWPGGIKIELEEDRFYSLLLPVYWSSVFGLYLYTPQACMFCSDAMSELADLSFGDAWLPEYHQDNLGRSIVISRTPAGESLLKKAINAGAIYLEALSLEKLIESQHSILYFKKRGLKARQILSKRSATEVTDTLIKTDPLDLILAGCFINFNSLVGRCKYGEILLSMIPLKLLSLYCQVIFKLFFNRRPLS